MSANEESKSTTMEVNTGGTNASNVTANYGLSQWAEGDRIRREDFNHDNAAIDTALHAQAAQTEAAIHAVEEGVSLVRLFSQTLAANTASVTIDLSDIDMSQFAHLELRISNMEITANGSVYVNFNGDSTSGNYLSGTGSTSTNSRVGIGQLYSSATNMIRLHLLAAKARIITHVEYRGCSSESITNGSAYAAWLGGGVGDLETISVAMSTGKLKSGATLTLYGYKK